MAVTLVYVHVNEHKQTIPLPVKCGRMLWSWADIDRVSVINSLTFPRQTTQHSIHKQPTSTKHRNHHSIQRQPTVIALTVTAHTADSSSMPNNHAKTQWPKSLCQQICSHSVSEFCINLRIFRLFRMSAGRSSADAHGYTHSVNAVNTFNKFHYNRHVCTNHNCFTTLFPGPLGEPVPEENFWTSWCKGRLTEADTQTIQLGATRSGLTSANLHHPTRNHVNDTCVLTACKCMSVCMHACLRTYMNNANGSSCLKEHTAVQWISKIWEHLASNITLASHKVSPGLDTVWHY